ncbi:MAG: hypothetical protein R3190_17775, partial [Thermoanaerobaculia bacterium]|nr:hypothetical protein [Thermoanaerobaculia bacterium]
MEESVASSEPAHRVGPRVRPRRSHPTDRWFAAGDVFYLLYLGPLRLLSKVLPSPAFLSFTRPLVAAYPRVQSGLRRRVAGLMANSFPERSEKEIAALAREYVAWFARRAVEDLVLADLGRRRPLVVEGMEHLEGALAGGRGALLFSGHFYPARVVRRCLRVQRGVTVTAVRRGGALNRGLGRFGARLLQPAYDRLLTRIIDDEVQTREGFGTLEMLRRLRANGVVFSTVDAAFARELWSVPLLGQPRVFPGGLLELARLAEAPLLPAELVEEAGRPCARFLPPLDLEPAPDREAFVATNLPRVVASFERTVARYPSQWEGWYAHD